ncbi:MAG TPA: hypothetical protein VJC18_06475 [bacterium]|nr:hypothetical protein [bacterium]
MKKQHFIFALLLVALIAVATNANAFSMKGEKVFGVQALGYYELNSDWESLYFDFAYNGSTQTAGFGFGSFFELGLSDRMSMEIDLAYSRLTYSNRQINIITENYFTADVVGHYYFLDNETYNPYFIFGLGAIMSANSVAPLGDVGVGMHFRVSKEFSVKTELLFKSAVLLNRGEGRLGVCYHF